jgi:FMN phosphatase YigB (HAD superfamily)
MHLNFNVKTIFVDIDTTLTDPIPELVGSVQIDPFAGLVAEINGISYNAAAEQIAEVIADIGNLTGLTFPFGILNKFGITDEQFWQEYAEYARNRLFMHSDAKDFLIGLKERFPKIKVYTATTNPQLIIYSKLAVSGLADKNGSPYLDGAFGGEEVYRGGKACPEFFTALLELTGADPQTTLMVGDSPEMDLNLAKAAGIDQVVLVRRDQKKEWIKEEDGGLYLKRLDFILDCINKGQKDERS